MLSEDDVVVETAPPPAPAVADPPLRVAILLPSVEISGGVGIILHHANKLVQEGCDVQVFAFNDVEYTEWYGKVFAELIVCPSEGKIAELVGDLLYDYCIGTFWSTVYAMRRGVIKAKKYFYFIQGDEEEFYDESDKKARAAVRQTLEGPEHKIVVSKYLKELLSTKNPGQLFYYVANGIDFARFNDAQPLMPKGKRPRILIEGPIGSPHKFVNRLLNEIRRIGGIEVWCLSSSEQEPVGALPHLTIKKLDYDKVQYVYKSCDILIKYSKTEGFSLPVLEMMASGGVPIINDFGGSRDFLKDGVNGRYIKEVAAEEILNAIQDVISNFDAYSEQAQNTAREYDWRNQSKALYDIMLNCEPNGDQYFGFQPYSSSGARLNMAARHVWYSASSEAIRRKLSPYYIVSGWIAKKKGGDVASCAMVTKNGDKREVTIDQQREDVVDYFSVNGVYGFRVFVDDLDPFSIQYSLDEETVKTIDVDLEVGVRVFDEVNFAIDAVRPAIASPFEHDKTLDEVFIQFKEWRNVKINGKTERVKTIFERRGTTIEFDDEKVGEFEKAIFRYSA